MVWEQVLLCYGMGIGVVVYTVMVWEQVLLCTLLRYGDRCCCVHKECLVVITLLISLLAIDLYCHNYIQVSITTINLAVCGMCVHKYMPL